MQTFGSYARYYNLLYKDKDHAGEAEYVHNLIYRHKPGAGEAGLRISEAGEWMTGRRPGFDTWGACFVVQG